MLNLNDLHVFVQVVAHGGFSATSRALGVPKSTLSKRIAQLEKSVGARLIQRTSRSFVVTEVGHEFYRHAAAMVIEAEAAENVVKGRLNAPSGTVRITASVATVQHMLAPLLPKLADTYPLIRIVLHATDSLVDIVQEGFDMAIRSHCAPLKDSDLVQRTLSDDPIWLVSSKAYLEKKGHITHPSEIKVHDGIMFSTRETSWSVRHDSGTLVEVSPDPRYTANEPVAVMEAAKLGLGIAGLPASFCRSQIASGDVVRILPDWTVGAISTTLLMPHRRGQLPSVRIIFDQLVQAFSDQDASNTSEFVSPSTFT